MSLITDIEKSYQQICLIEDISSVFEGIASIRIKQIKNRVISSKEFFDQLWATYHQLRSGVNIKKTKTIINKNAIIVITSAGGLSGEIDSKIIAKVATNVDKNKTDIIVFGEHGAVLLAERGFRPIKVFTLPNINKNFDVSPVIKLASQYKKTTVYYQTFVSLAVQRVSVIDLILPTDHQPVQPLSDVHARTINAENYEFEPSLGDVTRYMESIMLGIALQQMILESRLAQFGSRFTAMVMANTRAKEVKKDVRLKVLAAKRSLRDEASRQVTYSRGGR